MALSGGAAAGALTQPEAIDARLAGDRIRRTRTPRPGKVF